MLIGYARVSTDDQSVEMQIEALKNAGVEEENIYHENMSGTKRDRPQLKMPMQALREGDVFVVWKFDRVARSISHPECCINSADIHQQRCDYDGR